MTDDREVRAEVQSTAKGLAKRLRHLETGTLVPLWDILLERMNVTSKMLQSEGLPLNTAVHLLRSLASFIAAQRDSSKKFFNIGERKSGSSYFRCDQRKVTLRDFFRVELGDDIAKCHDASKSNFRL